MKPRTIDTPNLLRYQVPRVAYYSETPSSAFMPFRVHLWPNRKSLNLGENKITGVAPDNFSVTAHS
jgi:hypothetical protein